MYKGNNLESGTGQTNYVRLFILEFIYDGSNMVRYVLSM